METEMKGDGADEQKIQFEPCKHTNLERNGETCKYKDEYGNCVFENCKYDLEELPIHVTEWYFRCIVCNSLDCINPKHMKIHWCKSCIARAQDAEVLPFTCRYCGASQHSPSQWMFSKVCDKCIPRLYGPNCRRYAGP